MADKLQRDLMEYFVIVLCSGEGQVQRDGRQVAARPDGVSGCALRGESEGDPPPDGAGCSRERGRTVAGTTLSVQQRHVVGEQRARHGRRRYVIPLAKFRVSCMVPFKCYVTLFSCCTFDTHLPPRNANNVEPYTFVTLFFKDF